MAKEERSSFVIVEDASGKNTIGNNAKGVVLEFTVVNKSMPLQPWAFGIQQRTVRTDYPGGSLPTEQVLGWNFTPFTVEGVWQDKYNYDGYAIDTWKKFELLVQRGNPVTITWGTFTISGLITDADFEVKRQAHIGYKFTLSPHTRSKDKKIGKASERKSARTMESEQQEILDLIDELNKNAPLGFIAGNLVQDVVDKAKDMKRTIEEIQFAIETGFSGDAFSSSLTVLNLAGQFGKVATIGADMAGLVKLTSSANDLIYFTDAAKTLDFDYWHKQAAYVARTAVFFGLTNAASIKKQAEPDAKRLYRPAAGESMYAVSNKFYGTPHNWRFISERNNLDTFVMTGDELLVIPDIAKR